MAFTGLTEHERLTFERNPLQNVVAQVRFPHLYELEAPAGVTAFQRAVHDAYPIAQPREISVTLGPGPIQSDANRYKFNDPSGQWLVALTPDYIALESQAYERFDDFEERFSWLLERLVQHAGPARVERIGLRYINQLPANDQTWRRYIQSEVAGLAGLEDVAPYVSRSLEQLALDFGERGLIFTHGLLPGEDGEKTYVLDIDSYHAAAMSVDVGTIMEVLRELKRAAWSFFFGSITNRLVEDLGGRPIQET